MIRLALVGCGKGKRARLSPARELYTGGLFRASLAQAEATCDAVRIVSALHGLLHLDDPVGPYDLRIEQVGTRMDRRQAIGEPVARRLVHDFAPSETIVLLFMGASYADALTLPLLSRGFGVQFPLEGMKLGPRLSWLARQKRDREYAARAVRELTP